MINPFAGILWGILLIHIFKCLLLNTFGLISVCLHSHNLTCFSLTDITISNFPLPGEQRTLKSWKLYLDVCVCDDWWVLKIATAALCVKSWTICGTILISGAPRLASGFLVSMCCTVTAQHQCLTFEKCIPGNWLRHDKYEMFAKARPTHLNIN